MKMHYNEHMAADELRRRVRGQLDDHRRLTLNFIAQEKGLAASTLTRFMNNADHLPDPPTVRALSEFFDWPPVEAFRWADLLPPAPANEPLAELMECLYRMPWDGQRTLTLAALAHLLAEQHDEAYWRRRVAEVMAEWREDRFAIAPVAAGDVVALHQRDEALLAAFIARLFPEPPPR